MKKLIRSRLTVGAFQKVTKLPSGTPCFWRGFVLSFILTATLSGKILCQDADFTEPFKLHSFKKVGINTGLPARLGGILRDPKGYFWMNSSEGIFRFDGVRAKRYRYDPTDPEGLSQNQITGLFLGRSSGLWATTADNYLYRLDTVQDRFKIIRINPNTEKTQLKVKIRDLLEDRFGRLWVATEDKGLNILNQETGQLIHVDLSKYLPFDFPTIYDIMEDRQGNIWGIGWYLFRLNINREDQSIASATTYYGLPGDQTGKRGVNLVKCLVEDPEYGIWAAGLEGEIFKVDPQTREILKFSFNLEKEIVTVDQVETEPGNPELNTLFGSESGFSYLSSHVKSLHWDASGKIWIANNRNGLTIFDPLRMEVESYRSLEFDQKSETSYSVSDIYGDNDGIWLTTVGEGLYYYHPFFHRFGHFFSLKMVPSSLSAPVVTSFYQGVGGSIWIGTSSGLNLFNRQTGTVKRFFPSLSLKGVKSDGIFSITSGPSSPPSSGENLWIGSNSGLLSFDSFTGHFKKWEAVGQGKHQLSSNYVSFLNKDAFGRLWAVTYLPYQIFVSDIQGKEFRSFKLEYEGEVLEFPSKILGDQQQNYWIVTEDEKRLFNLDLKTRQLREMELSEHDSNEFPFNLVQCFWKDHKNRQWVGTSKGLYFLYPKKEKNKPYRFKKFTESDGLCDNTIVGLVEDGTGFLWITTQNGVSRLDLTSMAFQNFYKGNGLQSNLFSGNAIMLDTLGEDIYLGGINGFNVFNPQSLALDTSESEVLISSILVFRDSTMQPISPEFNGSMPVIHLFHGDKLLNIQFAAQNFVAPELNQYAVMLKGYNEQWRIVGNQSEVNYTNLDPGTYFFNVKASNQDGHWSEQITSLKVVVYAPWWSSLWAYIFYLTLAGFVIYQIIKFQISRYREKLELNRIKELGDLKNEFFASVSHEFRTPLTVILGMAEKAGIYFKDNIPDKHAHAMELIRRNSLNLMIFSNQLLDLSKSEKGKLQVINTQSDIVSYIGFLLESFQSLAVSREIQLHFLPEQAPVIMDFDKEKMLVIVYNLISNAIKFTPIGGAVHVNLNILQMEPDLGSQTLILKVKDNGIGIQESVIPYIFDQYFQVQPSNLIGKDKYSSGTGLGLATVKKYVLLMQGEIEVTSNMGSGTEFTIRLPITKVAPLDASLELQDFKSSNYFSESFNPAVNLNTEQTGVSKRELPILLIVEGDLEAGLFIAASVEGQYEIHFASNGQDGIDKAIRLLPDIILSAFKLPKKNGFDLCRALKQEKSTAHIPIILLTHSYETHNREKNALEIRPDAYLSKPFGANELAMLLKKFRNS